MPLDLLKNNNFCDFISRLKFILGNFENHLKFTHKVRNHKRQLKFDFELITPDLFCNCFIYLGKGSKQGICVLRTHYSVILN